MTCSVLVPVGTVDGCGYNGQQEDAICDTGSWTVTNNSKHIQASFSLILTDWLHLRVAQMPRSQDLAIFVVTTDEQMNRRTERPITLPLCMRTG